MTETFDLAVVGGGIVGSAIAFHAARLGGRVVVVDKSAGVRATDQSSGIVRVHQPDMTLAPLSHLGWAEFSNWEGVVHRKSTFRRTGCVHDVTADGSDVHDDVDELRRRGWACSVVGESDLRALYPEASWRPGTTAVFEPDAGYADAACCRRQYLGRVEELGGSVRLGETVLGVSAASGAAGGIQTDRGHISAGAVVLATGGWAGCDGLRPTSMFGIRPRRIFWQGVAGSFSALPCYVREGSEALYFRPTGDGGLRFGVGCEDWDVDPEAAGRRVDDALIERGRDRIAECVGVRPNATTPISAVDGYSADGRPVIDKWPEIDGLYVALGFSGGGFKVAPAVGVLLAAWAATGAVDPMLAPFAGSRLRDRPLAASVRQPGED